MSVRRITMTMAVLILYAASTPAVSQDVSVTLQIRDLETHEGRQVLLDRMEREARNECRVSLQLPPHYVGGRQKCQSLIMNDLLAAVDDDRLSHQYHGLASTR